MAWYCYVAWLFAGVFIANAVPHVVSATMGRGFQSPFAKPPGRGLSSSTVNALWGWLNLVIGWVLLFRVGGFDLRRRDDFAALAIGMLSCSLFNARNFGRWNGGNHPPPSAVTEAR